MIEFCIGAIAGLLVGIALSKGLFLSAQSAVRKAEQTLAMVREIQRDTRELQSRIDGKLKELGR